MKPHIVLKTKLPIVSVSVPYWVDFISNRLTVITSIHPDIDRIMQAYALPFWVCSEYKPVGATWSDIELDSALHKIFRIVIQEDKIIPDGCINQLNALPIVEYARRGEITSTIIPSTQTQQQIDLKNRPSEQIYVKQAHLFTQGNENIKVAVLDTGVHVTHPEIVHAIIPGMDFVNIIDGAEKFLGDYLGVDNDPEDEVGHGTHVSGIIAGKGIKIARGVAPSCKIMPVRVLGAMRQGDARVGAGLVDNINTGIKWAVDNGADIINMSLGIKNEGGGLPHEEVIRYAIKKGVTIIAASGNDGTNDKYYPGALPDVIAVGAIDENGETASFSTYGWHVSVVAPGTNIMSSYTDDKYAVSSGTSQASPFVTGVVALLKSYALQHGVTLKDHQVKYLLKRTADKKNQQVKTIKQGYGKVNAVDALRLLQYKLQLN